MSVIPSSRLGRALAAIPSRRLSSSLEFDENQHPRDQHGRFGDKGDPSDRSVDSEADHYAAAHDLIPATPAAVERATLVWCSTFDGCDGTQAAADAYVGHGGAVKDDEYAFAARELVDAIGDNDASGHQTITDPLYRGMTDPTGQIAATFTPGATVDFALASFSEDDAVAQSFADRGIPPLEPGQDHRDSPTQVFLQTSGPVEAVDVQSAVQDAKSTEAISGGSWKVTDVADDAARPNRPARTTITIEQQSVPRRAA